MANESLKEYEVYLSLDDKEGNQEILIELLKAVLRSETGKKIILEELKSILEEKDKEPQNKPS